jgi:flagellar biosynthesis protein FliR
MNSMLDIMDAGKITAFWLIVCRLSGLFLTAPLLSQNHIPLMVKSQWTVLLAFLFACLLPPAKPITHEGQLVILAFQEGCLGAMLGLTVQLLMTAFQLAGEFVAVQSGLNLAGIYDPVSHTPSTALSNLMSMFALLAFIGLDGHHWLLAGLAQSLRLLPPGLPYTLTPDLMQTLQHLPQGLFVLGLHLALPTIGTLVLVDIAAGYLAKTMPQLNLLTLTPPLKILLGLSMLSANLPACYQHLSHQVSQLPQQLSQTLPRSPVKEASTAKVTPGLTTADPAAGSLKTPKK